MTWRVGVLLLLLLFAMVPGTAAAQGSDESGGDDLLLRINGDVHIAADEEIDSVIVIGADAVIEGTVRDFLLVIDGTAQVSGRALGDVVLANGTLDLQPGSTVENVSLYRSEFQRAEGATVLGEVHERTGFGFSEPFLWLFWLSMTIVVVAAGLLFAAVGGRQLTGALGCPHRVAHRNARSMSSRADMTRNLLDIVHRVLPPAPWSGGEKIPWHDPAFSARMLREHLSQAHDGASRRSDRIAAHVRWIHERLLHSWRSRVLDLACGPGLYTARLASLGHDCVGIDFAPAAIDHARQAAVAARLACTYHLADIRTADYGNGHGLVMLIFGELNVFRSSEAQAIVTKAQRALVDGGLLLLEVHTAAAVRRMGEAPPTWRSAEQGIFSPRPHLRLEESFWDDEQQVATHRYLIIDAACS